MIDPEKTVDYYVWEREMQVQVLDDGTYDDDDDEEETEPE